MSSIIITLRGKFIDLLQQSRHWLQRNCPFTEIHLLRCLICMRSIDYDYFSSQGARTSYIDCAGGRSRNVGEFCFCTTLPPKSEQKIGKTMFNFFKLTSSNIHTSHLFLKTFLRIYYCKFIFGCKPQQTSQSSLR